MGKIFNSPTSSLNGQVLAVARIYPMSSWHLLTLNSGSQLDHYPQALHNFAQNTCSLKVHLTLFIKKLKMSYDKFLCDVSLEYWLLKIYRGCQKKSLHILRKKKVALKL